jgi:hypothetical protein
MVGNCVGATAQIDATILNYEGPTQYCFDQLENGQVVIQNLSLGGNLTEATIQTLLDGNIISTTEYSGNLALYAIDTIQLNPIGNLPEEATLTFNLVVEGDTILENNQKDIDVARGKTINGFNVIVEIQPDDYPAEFSFDMLDGNGNLIYESEPLSGSSLQQFEVTIPEITCVTWNIYDSYGDGICCEYGEGYVRLLDAQSGDEIFLVNGDYGFGTTRLFATLDSYIGIQENVSYNIRIYPNPASELVNIVSDVEIISLSIFNNVGQTMETRAIDGKYYSLDIKKFHAGVYTLKITTARGMAVNQIMVE